MNISLIAAVSENNVIGNQNRLPWHLPADLAHFKKLTLNKPIVMGRKTFESIGKPLPMRRNIVISRQKNFYSTGIEIYSSLEAALEILNDETEVMVIGGESLFQKTLTSAKIIYLTRIHALFNGDTYFPILNLAEWHEIQREDHLADRENPYNYSFITLEKICAA